MKKNADNKQPDKEIIDIDDEEEDDHKEDKKGGIIDHEEDKDLSEELEIKRMIDTFVSFSK